MPEDRLKLAAHVRGGLPVICVDARQRQGGEGYASHGIGLLLKDCPPYQRSGSDDRTCSKRHHRPFPATTPKANVVIRGPEIPRLA
jgi:hypothetical protein